MCIFVYTVVCVTLSCVVLKLALSMACVCLNVCVHAYVCMCVHVYVCVILLRVVLISMPSIKFARVHVCLCVCVYGSMCLCVHASMCLGVCMSICVCHPIACSSDTHALNSNALLVFDCFFQHFARGSFRHLHLDHSPPLCMYTTHISSYVFKAHFIISS